MAEFGLTQVYEEIERPLCPVLAEMEQAGVLVDQAALAHFGQTLQTGIEVLQGRSMPRRGEKFNINSTQQLGRVLFEGLGLPPVKKTKTGYSTSAEVLEKLRPQHPIIDLILEYRQLTKLNSTYVEGLAKVIAPDGRIHTSFQNTVTATGRLSSTEPNLQNIPVRTELGAQIRTMFIARPGWVLVDADYSQIELRLLAHMAGDEKMIAAFQSGQDIHAQTASQVFGLPPEEVTGELRRRAKAVNFGIVYGISDFSLAQDIGVSRQEAADYMNKYLATFSGVREYMEHVKAQAKEDGYVATLMGRRRWLPELKSTNYNLRAFGERVALNMPIQGTAADVMKLAMIRVARRLKAEGLQAQLILQVHDELIVECPQEEADQVKALLTQEMEGAGNFSVPLVAEAGPAAVGPRPRADRKERIAMDCKLVPMDRSHLAGWRPWKSCASPSLGPRPCWPRSSITPPHPSSWRRARRARCWATPTSTWCWTRGTSTTSPSARSAVGRGSGTGCWRCSAASARPTWPSLPWRCGPPTPLRWPCMKSTASRRPVAGRTTTPTPQRTPFSSPAPFPRGGLRMQLRDLTLDQLRWLHATELHEAFPAEELKPFPAMEQLFRRGPTARWAPGRGRPWWGMPCCGPARQQAMCSLTTWGSPPPGATAAWGARSSACSRRSSGLGRGSWWSPRPRKGGPEDALRRLAAGVLPAQRLPSPVL